MNPDKKNILIVSGGTGGHIFPALVFGRWLERNRGASVHYLCGSRPLELEIYRSSGVTPHCLSLDGSPLGVRAVKTVLRRSMATLRAFSETARCLAGVKPEIVFLFGGYISFAPLLLCRVKKIPVVVHEQNAVAGRVTRLASRLGAVVTAGWQECAGLHGPFITAGIPVREPGRLPREEALTRLGLEHSNFNFAKIVGTAGGSLGSRPLTEKIFAAADSFTDTAFLFLGNPPDSLKNKNHENIFFVGPQWDMNPFYSLCDVLICRAGGSTLAEALAWKIPTITVPWEGAAEGHQVRNALCFAAAGGGIVCRENEGDGPLFASAIKNLLSSGAKSNSEAAVKTQTETEEACRVIAHAAGL